MTSHRFLAGLSSVAALLVVATSSAFAEAPKFEYPELPKELPKEGKPQWKASAQAGLLMTTGNSTSTSISSAFKASRKSGANKLAIDLGGAFARSTIFIVNDLDGDGAVDESELDQVTQTTTQAWMVKLRYDRFLSARNALYGSSKVSGDEPAGKRFIGSGQLGYSRTLVKSKTHDIVAEGGYDFSYEDLIGQSNALSIHSLRAFLGYEGKLSEDSGLQASTEFLFNLNELATVTGPIVAFEDTRFNGNLSLTTKVYGDMSFRFAFMAKYDHAPAPRPNLAIPYDDGFRPLADRLDTRTEAAIIVNFL